MKCPRCRSDMKRRKLKENQFIYVCPKCNAKVGGRDDQRTMDEGVSEEYLEAYKEAL